MGNKVEFLCLDDAYQKMRIAVDNAKTIKIVTRVAGTESESNVGSKKRTEYYEALLRSTKNTSQTFERILVFSKELEKDYQWIGSLKNFKLIHKEIDSIYSKGNLDPKELSFIKLCFEPVQLNYILIDDDKLFFNIYSEYGDTPDGQELMFYVESDRSGMNLFSLNFEQLKLQSSNIPYKKLKE